MEEISSTSARKGQMITIQTRNSLTTTAEMVVQGEQGRALNYNSYRDDLENRPDECLTVLAERVEELSNYTRTVRFITLASVSNKFILPFGFYVAVCDISTPQEVIETPTSDMQPYVLSSIGFGLMKIEWRD